MIWSLFLRGYVPRYRSLIGHLEMFLSAVEKKHEKFSRRLAKKKKKNQGQSTERKRQIKASQWHWIIFFACTPHWLLSSTDIPLVPFKQRKGHAMIWNSGWKKDNGARKQVKVIHQNTVDTAKRWPIQDRAYLTTPHFSGQYGVL